MNESDLISKFYEDINTQKRNAFICWTVCKIGEDPDISGIVKVNDIWYGFLYGRRLSPKQIEKLLNMEDGTMTLGAEEMEEYIQENYPIDNMWSDNPDSIYAMKKLIKKHNLDIKVKDLQNLYYDYYDG